MRNYNQFNNPKNHSAPDQETSQQNVPPYTAQNQTFQNNSDNTQKIPNIDSDKIDFLASLMKEANGKNQSDMMPFLMNITQRANEKGIQFSDEETEMLVQLMTANMSPAERKKVELLRRMSKMMAKRKN